MKTVGSILKEARLSKGLGLDVVEKDTKIRLKFLESIEADDYTNLPSLSYAKGFVKNYSQFLGLDGNRVLAFFRRQTKDISRASILPKGVAEPLNKPLMRLTPARFLGIILFLLVTIFLSYLGRQYYNLNTPPGLAIETPAAQLVTSEHRVDLLGKTDPDATVTVNGVSTLVRSDGKFFDQMTLETGINHIIIVATSRYGKTTTVTRDVVYQP